MNIITQCQIGCAGNLVATNIILQEGPLLKCEACDQLFSSCTWEQYERSLEKWNTENGTIPNHQSEKRLEQIVKRRLLKGLDFVTSSSNPMQLLDVGCSSGALLAIAQKVGFSVRGVETAPKAAKTAQKAGFDVFQGFLHEAQYPDESFDMIVLFELVEHINDPISLLTECRRILKPGGVILINTPNANSWTSTYMRSRWSGFSLTEMGGHISFFSPKSMLKLASSVNLDLVHVKTKNVRFYEKNQCNIVKYKLAKVASELLAYPAIAFNKGHDLFAVLRR